MTKPAETEPDDWVEVATEVALEKWEQRPRNPSLPALNLVTAQQELVVDLLESPEHPLRFDSHAWPHSPSTSVASLTTASPAGIYIVLDDTDPDDTLSDRHMPPRPRPCPSGPNLPSFPAGLTTSPRAGRVLDLPLHEDYDSDSSCASSWSEVTETGRQWAVCAVQLGEAPSPAGPGPLAPETPLEACFPSTPLPSRPVSPASSDSDDPFDPMLGLLALASSPDPKRLSFRSQRRGQAAGGAVIGGLGRDTSSRGTNNGASQASQASQARRDNGSAASDTPPDPDLALTGLGGGSGGPIGHRLTGVAGAGNRRSSGIMPPMRAMQATLATETRIRRVSLPSLPTLVLLTSSCTSLLLVDQPLTPVFASDSDSDEDLLAEIPFDLSPLRRIGLVDQTIPSAPAYPATPAVVPAVPAVRTDHAARTGSGSDHTTTKQVRPPNRRAATSPAEHDHSRDSRDSRAMKDDAHSAHLTRIDSLFPPSSGPKHGLGLGGLGGLGGRRGRGPLSLFGLRRSLSVGHGSKTESQNAGQAGAKSPKSPRDSNDARGPEHHGHPYPTWTLSSARSGSFSASTSGSARSSIDNNGFPQALHALHALHAGEISAHASLPGSNAGLATPTPGERKLPAVPLPVTPTSPAHGPHSPASAYYASYAQYATADPYHHHPSCPYQRFQRYHYLPSSSRGSSPRSLCFPQHAYDHLLPANASDAASAVSGASASGHSSGASVMTASASPDPSSSWHEHSPGHPGAGAARGQVGPVLDAGHAGHAGHAGLETSTGDLAGAQPVTGSTLAWPAYTHGEYSGGSLGSIFGQCDEVLSTLLGQGSRGDNESSKVSKGDREPTGASDGDASEGTQGRNASLASRSVHPGIQMCQSDDLDAIDARSERLGSLGAAAGDSPALHTATRIPSISEHCDRTAGTAGNASGTASLSLPASGSGSSSGSRSGSVVSIPKDDNSPTLEPVQLDDHHSYHSCDDLISDRDKDHQDLNPSPSPSLASPLLPSLTLPSLDFSAPPVDPPTPAVPAAPASPAAPSSPAAAQVTAFTYHTYPTGAQTAQTAQPAALARPSKDPIDPIAPRDSKDAITLKSPSESPDLLCPDSFSLDHQDPLDKRTKTCVQAVTAVGPPVLAIPPTLPADVHDQLESSSSHSKMEVWNPYPLSNRMYPPDPGHGFGGNNLGRKTSPRPSPLPSPAPSQGLSHDGSPLSPTTTSSASIHDTKSIKEKPKKKGGWFGRKNKDEDETPAKPVEKKKKKKPAYGGGGGYLDSLMLPPGQPLNQTVHAPGGGRAATKSPRRKPSSVEPMSPTWSHSQPDSDRARSVRRPSSKDVDNNGIVVEIDARSSPPTPHHIPLPPLTPQSTSGLSSAQRLASQNRPPLPTQPHTPNTLPLSLSPRSSTLRLDPLPAHLQHGSESSSGSVANKEFDKRRLSQYTISSLSGSEYSQSLPSATMQRSTSGPSGLYPVGERGTVSTVFEEEYPQTQTNGRSAQQSNRRPSTIDSDDGWARDSQGGHSQNHYHPRTGERPSALQLHHTTLPARRQYTPSPGLPTVSLSPRTQRSSTISSTHSASSKPKTPASHPFASGRAPSPNHPADYLTPPAGSPPAVPSHAFPAINDNFKMPAPAIPAHQVALASPEDEQGDPDCPVCCESMSFTFRLPGEKPHVVPECGHALHEECFVTVYGPVPPEGSQKNIGVCGVCRQPMRVNGNDRSSGNNKLATLMGGSESASSGYEIVDPQSDDPLEPVPSPTSPVVGRTPPAEAPPLQVVVPRIEVRPEFQSVRRSKTGKQNITVLVVVEVPPAADRSKYPARQRRTSAADSYANLPPSPSSSGSFRESVMSGIQAQKTPFANVLADTKRRLVAYKYSGLESVGALCLFDILKVRKASNVQDFHLYLFQDALICVSEERKSGISGGLFKKSQPESPNESVLRMRGRIFLRDVHQVTDSSTVSELSIALTLETQEHGVDSIVICFSDRNSHEMWRATIRRLIDDAQIANGTNRNKIEKLLGGAPQRPPSRAHSTTSSGGGGSGRPIAAVQASTMNLFSDASEACTASCPVPCPGALAFNVPIAAHHTPIDIVLAIATPALAPGAALPLKTRLMRTALHFVLATMGPRDRVSIVAAELGPNAVVRRTPLLNATRHDSRKRLEAFVEGIGAGGRGDEFEIETQEEKPDVVTAVNVALDVILQRKVKNPLGGLVLISDASDLIKRQQMDLVTARLDAAKIPVHCFGYGKAHDPSPLWMISNHTHGTYTFVKEWYHLRDALAGVIGGLMSIALTKVGLRLACQDDDFRVVKVSGASQAVISSSGRDIDIDLNILRHGEVREILIDFELESDPVPGTPYGSATPIDSEGDEGRPLSRQQSTSTASNRRPSLARAYSGGSVGMNGNGLGELAAREAAREASGSYEDGSIEEVPVVEVDCTFHDPLAGRSAARMMNPLLLTLALLPPSSNPSSSAADSVIVRRRMELLASDMITRALLAGSRKNFGQATRILRETKRILETKSDHLRASVSSSPHRSRRDIATLAAIDGLSATIQDVDMILDGIETNQDMFEADYRNYAAQQTVILRTQRSWMIRTPTEVAYATPDVQGLIQASGEYAPRAQ